MAGHVVHVHVVEVERVIVDAFFPTTTRCHAHAYDCAGELFDFGLLQRC